MCTRAALLDLLYLDLDLRRVSPSERLLYLGACSIVTAGTARAMYNVFRLTGDGLHCLALIVLFAKMNATRSCAGARSTDTEPSAGGLSALSRSSAELMQPRARAAVPNAAPLAAAGVSLKTAYLYAIVFSCRCTSQQLRRPLRRLLRRSGQSAAALRPPHLPCSHADEPAGFSSCTDLDLITMWFIELPEGTSLWEYTSVRTPRLQATLGRSACPSRGAVG